MNTAFCDNYGIFCFEMAMKNVTKEEECFCPLECDAINYSYYYVSSPFNPDKMCPGSRKDISANFLMKEFYLNPMPPVLLSRMEMFTYNKTDR